MIQVDDHMVKCDVSDFVGDINWFIAHVHYRFLPNPSPHVQLDGLAMRD